MRNVVVVVACVLTRFLSASPSLADALPAAPPLTVMTQNMDEATDFGLLLEDSSQQDPATNPDLTPDRVQALFINRGFQVEQLVRWDWTAPPVTSFRVLDPWFDRRTSAELVPTDRVLMVMVYGDSATAASDRLRAQARDESVSTSNGALMTDRGPHLVPGYGPSIWWRNVAMVESSQSELNRLYAAEIDRDIQVVVRTGPDGQPAMQALNWQAGTMSREALVWLEVQDDFIAVLQDASRIDL